MLMSLDLISRESKSENSDIILTSIFFQSALQEAAGFLGGGQLVGFSQGGSVVKEGAQQVGFLQDQVGVMVLPVDKHQIAEVAGGQQMEVGGIVAKGVLEHADVFSFLQKSDKTFYHADPVRIFRGNIQGRRDLMEDTGFQKVLQPRPGEVVVGTGGGGKVGVRPGQKMLPVRKFRAQVFFQQIPTHAGAEAGLIAEAVGVPAGGGEGRQFLKLKFQGGLKGEHHGPGHGQQPLKMLFQRGNHLFGMKKVAAGEAGTAEYRLVLCKKQAGHKIKASMVGVYIVVIIVGLVLAFGSVEGNHPGQALKIVVALGRNALPAIVEADNVVQPQTAACLQQRSHCVQNLQVLRLGQNADLIRICSFSGRPPENGVDGGGYLELSQQRHGRIRGRRQLFQGAGVRKLGFFADIPEIQDEFLDIPALGIDFRTQAGDLVGFQQLLLFPGVQMDEFRNFLHQFPGSKAALAVYEFIHGRPVQAAVLGQSRHVYIFGLDQFG